MSETINMLKQAANEIRQLRRQNELLDVQVDVVHIFAAALGLRKQMGMGEDLAWKIDTYIKHLENKCKPTENGE